MLMPSAFQQLTKRTMAIVICYINIDRHKNQKTMRSEKTLVIPRETLPHTLSFY